MSDYLFVTTIITQIIIIIGFGIHLIRRIFPSVDIPEPRAWDITGEGEDPKYFVRGAADEFEVAQLMLQQYPENSKIPYTLDHLGRGNWIIEAQPK